MTVAMKLSLPDDSTLVIHGGAGLSPAAQDELETWSLIDPLDVPVTTRADPIQWIEAFGAGGLALAALKGVIGNAAWSVFPAAARFLSSIRSGPRLDASEVADAARTSVVEVLQVAPGSVSITSITRTKDAWQVEAKVRGGRLVSVTLSLSGRVSQVRMSSSTTQEDVSGPS
jgi:hypothetical protein